MTMNPGNNTRTASKLFVFTLAMFGFGYVLVPLYDVFCDVTGINGKTGTISAEDASKAKVDRDRLVTIEFDTNINDALPWDFKASRFSMKVHPGEITDMVFIAENKSAETITGQAVPSVAPQEASLYFNKTECFCFSQQTLQAGERREMLVRFVVDTDLPQKISTLTLSYTFFTAPDSGKVIGKEVPVNAKNGINAT